MDFFSLLLIIILGLILFSIALSSISLAPWVPCRNRDLKRILRLADLKPGQSRLKGESRQSRLKSEPRQVFYDLGCGNGKVVVYIARHSQAQVIGIELAWPLWLICKIRGLFVPRAKFKLKNLFKQDLGQADVVYFFGTPSGINERLKRKFKKELKSGTKVISYAFKIKEWKPVLIDKPTEKDTSIYVYEI